MIEQNEFASFSRGRKIPALTNPEYLESPSRPRGKATVERPRPTGTKRKSLRTSSLKPQVSSLRSKRTRSELTITLIQLLSGGACERRSPLKSTEDSANAVARLIALR